MRFFTLFFCTVLSFLSSACNFENTEKNSAVPNLLVGISHVCEDRFEYFNNILAINTELCLAVNSADGIVQSAQGPVRIQFLSIPVIRKKGMAKRIFHEHANNYDLKLVIGNVCSLTGTEMSEAAEDLRIPFLAPVAVAPSVTENKDFSFPTSPLMADRASVYASYLINELRSKRVAILSKKGSLAGTIYSRVLRERFQNGCASLVLFEEYDTLEDIPASLDNIVQAKPDAVLFCPVAPHIFSIGEGLAKRGWHGDLVGIRSEQGFSYKQHLPQPPLPIHFLSFWNPAFDQGNKEMYLDAFRKNLNRDPTEDDVFVYDATLRIIRAVEQSPSLDSVSLQKSLQQQNAFAGAAGQYCYNPRPTLDSLWVIDLKNGKDDVRRLSLPGTENAGDCPERMTTGPKK